MSIFEYDEEGVKEVLQQQWKELGREEGEEIFADLTERLVRDSRLDDLLRATKDREYRNLLYREFHIKVKDERKE